VPGIVVVEANVKAAIATLDLRFHCTCTVFLSKGAIGIKAPAEVGDFLLDDLTQA